MEMKKWMMVGIVLLSSGCAEEEGPGTQCCALQKYCDECEYCKDDERTIGDSEDETACKQVNDRFLDVGRYCSPSQQRVRTTEFIAECTSD